MSGDWRLRVCCDMMQEGLDCGQVVVADGPAAVLPYTRPTESIDYCPWCGRKIVFRRED